MLNSSPTYLIEVGKFFLFQLNIKETCFRSVDAKNVSVHEAIEKKLITFDELKHYAWRIIKDGDSLVLKYYNYEIVCAYDDCVIKPKSQILLIILENVCQQ